MRGRPPEDRGGAGQGQPDLAPGGPDRLEYVDRADHVDHGPERRVRRAERELQAGQVDQVGDAAVGHQGGHVAAAGHVEFGEFEPVVGLSLGDEPETAQVRAQVGGHDRHALVEQQPQRPRADAARGAGDQEPLR